MADDQARTMTFHESRDYDSNGFPGGGKSLIRTFGNGIIAIADGDGIWIFFDSTSDLLGFHGGDSLQPARPLAEIILNGLPEDLTPEMVEHGFGFESV